MKMFVLLLLLSNGDGSLMIQASRPMGQAKCEAIQTELQQTIDNAGEEGNGVAVTCVELGGLEAGGQ